MSARPPGPVENRLARVLEVGAQHTQSIEARRGLHEPLRRSKLMEEQRLKKEYPDKYAMYREGVDADAAILRALFDSTDMEIAYAMARAEEAAFELLPSPNSPALAAVSMAVAGATFLFEMQVLQIVDPTLDKSVMEMLYKNASSVLLYDFAVGSLEDGVEIGARGPGHRQAARRQFEGPFQNPGSIYEFLKDLARLIRDSSKPKSLKDAGSMLADFLLIGPIFLNLPSDLLSVGAGVKAAVGGYLWPKRSRVPEFLRSGMTWTRGVAASISSGLRLDTVVPSLGELKNDAIEYVWQRYGLGDLQKEMLTQYLMASNAFKESWFGYGASLVGKGANVVRDAAGYLIPAMARPTPSYWQRAQESVTGSVPTKFVEVIMYSLLALRFAAGTTPLARIQFAVVHIATRVAQNCISYDIKEVTQFFKLNGINLANTWELQTVRGALHARDEYERYALETYKEEIKKLTKRKRRLQEAQRRRREQLQLQAQIVAQKVLLRRETQTYKRVVNDRNRITKWFFTADWDAQGPTREEINRLNYDWAYERTILVENMHNTQEELQWFRKLHQQRRSWFKAHSDAINSINSPPPNNANAQKMTQKFVEIVARVKGGSDDAMLRSRMRVMAPIILAGLLPWYTYWRWSLKDGIFKINNAINEYTQVGKEVRDSAREFDKKKDADAAAAAAAASDDDGDSDDGDDDGDSDDGDYDDDGDSDDGDYDGDDGDNDGDDDRDYGSDDDVHLQLPEPAEIEKEIIVDETKRDASSIMNLIKACGAAML